MAFQSEVRDDQAFGVPGEVRLDAPQRATSYTIDSVDPANNVFGRAFTVKSQGIAEAGGTGVFAGIMANPKQHSARGTQAGGTLAATLTLANEEQADMLEEGVIIVDLATTANIGDKVIFNDTTGILSANAPADAVPGGSSNAFAEVVRFTLSAPGLAVIHVNKFPPVVL